MYTSGTLSCHANEFHPDRSTHSERDVLPYAVGNPAIPTTTVFPASSPPGLLGPLLPGFVNSQQLSASGMFSANLRSQSVSHLSEFNNPAIGRNTETIPQRFGTAGNVLNQFVPPAEDIPPFSGTGHLPGQHANSGHDQNPCSDQWPSLHACRNPISFGSCFQSQGCGPIAGGNMGGWGAGGEQEETDISAFQPPQQSFVSQCIPISSLPRRHPYYGNESSFHGSGARTADFGKSIREQDRQPPQPPDGYDPSGFGGPPYPGDGHRPARPPPVGDGGFHGGGGGFYGGGAQPPFPPPPPPPAPPPAPVPQPLQNRWAAKRWLPPPAWSPGGQGQPSYRGWLWQLAGWSRLTGMPFEDRGTAVALSLGGRAGRIAQSLPHELLGRRDGLYLLLQKIETELGSELQDRVRSAGRLFMRFRRPRNMPAAEYISEFERLYSEGVQHGLFFNTTMLSMLMIEHCGLTSSQEEWILQTVAADWTKYAEIKTALRRLPSLDQRHTNEGAQAWPTTQNEHHVPSHLQVPRPFQDQQLNRPVAEPWSASASQSSEPWNNQSHQPWAASSSTTQEPWSAQPTQSWSAAEQPIFEDHANHEFTGAIDDADTDSDDDFCSSCPSDLEPEQNMLVQQAWAFKVGNRFAFKRKGGARGKGRRKGYSRPKSTWVMDSKRNLSEEVPTGWDKSKWLSRTPCPGCGSRWHCNCEGKGKAFPVFKKQRQGKGHKGSSSSTTAGQKGGFKGRSGFGIFLATAATLMTSAQSMLTNMLPNFDCQTSDFECFECCPSSNYRLDVEHARPKYDLSASPDAMFSSSPFALQNETICLDSSLKIQACLNDQAESVPCFLADNDSRCVVKGHHLRQWTEQNQFVFMASQNENAEWYSDSSNTFVGLEPKSADLREKRWEAFTTMSKQRFGILLDTGAPESCVGRLWFNRFAEAFDVTSLVEWIPHKASLSGIGQGSAKCNYIIHLPVGLETGDALWKSQLLDGIGEPVPPLLGLGPMSERGAVIDLRDPHKNGTYHMHVDSDTGGRDCLAIHWCNGHVVLPVDWGGCSMPSKSSFLTDPLGLSIWLGETDNDDIEILQTSDKIQTNLDETPRKETETFTTTQPVTTNGADKVSRVKFEAFDSLAQTTNYTPESSSWSGPDDPSTKTMMTSVTACPADNVSGHNSRLSQTHMLPSFVAPAFELPPGLPRQTTTGPVAKLAYTTSQTKDTCNIDERPQALPAAQYAIVKQLRKSAKTIQQILSNNKTYNKKYKGLPLGTSIPPIDTRYTSLKTWDFWEWWAGDAVLTRTASREGMTTGPPISWNTGWCLKLQTHRDALKHLLTVYTPTVLFGAPTCAPWSNASTTFDHEVKEIVREEELVVFRFFSSCCVFQWEAGRFYLYEQPKSSELLRTRESVALCNRTNSSDNICCMCMHDLRDPYTKKPNMKATTLRGTVILTDRTNRWCDHSHVHQQLKGCLPNGVLRTSVAQTYTSTFCKRVARDIMHFIKGDMRNYPIEVVNLEDEQEGDEIREYERDTQPPPQQASTREERKEKLIEESKNRRQNASEILPETPEPIAIPKRLLPTAKKLSKRRNAEEDNDFVEYPEERVGGSSSSKGPDAASAVNPFKELTDKWDAEEARTDKNPKVTRKSSKVLPSELPDAVLDLAVPLPMELASSRPLTAEQMAVITEMKESVAHRVPIAGTATIQSGNRLKMLQELFGTPFNKVVLGAVIARKPKTSIQPEPLLSREVAPFKLELTIDNQKAKWTMLPWQKYSTTFYTRKPLWLLILYGRDAAEGEIANHTRSSPWDLMEDAKRESDRPATNLSSFMKIMREGTEPDKIAAILTLHKRLYHKPADDLRRLLQKSGAALHALSIVGKAVDQCDICRNWAKAGAKPATKVMHAMRFNAIVYVDLVFFNSFIVMVCVDEAIRFTVIWVMEYKDTESFIKAFRQCWVRWFGPPKIVRSDKEGALTAEEFGISLERMGTQRELILADQQHSYLGILDRRVQIIRFMMPKIIQELSAEFIVCDPEDAAAECQYCVNALMQYRGSTPYECLFGQNPNNLFEEASDFISSNVDDILGFYEMHQARAKAIQVFQEAVLQQRIERAVDSRPRADNQSSFRIGQWVDIYRKPKNKSLEGWRGPAVVLAHLGEGFLTCRWQGICMDVPVNHVRPHIVLSPHAAPGNSGPAPLEILPEATETTAPLAEAQVAANIVFDQCEWEVYYGEESTDNAASLHHSAHALVAVASGLPLGSQLLHVITIRQGAIISSEQARRDGHQLFNLGKEWATSRNIQNYIGVIICAGRRFISQQANVSTIHATWWIGDVANAVMQHSVFEGDQPLDWIKQGVSYAQLPSLRVLLVLEGKAVQGPPLIELLKNSSNPEPVDSFELKFGATGRVRNHPMEIPDLTRPLSAATTRIASANDTLNESSKSTVLDDEGFDVNIVENQFPDVFIARIRSQRLLNPEPESYDKLEKSVRENVANSSSSTCTPSEMLSLDSEENWSPQHAGYIWLVEDFCFAKGKYLPLARDAGSLSPQDYIDHEVECTDAAIKELTAWVKMKAGKPVRTKEYNKRTGLRPLPSRWVDIWKTKNKKKLIKRRLVLKGYAERNQQNMETASPTASRIGHRMIMWKSAEWGLPIVSYDVSTAFLQGDTFETLNATGHARQSCAFNPPPGVYKILHQIDPDGGWKDAMESPHEWSIELDKGAYGLKDAPLLWFLRINRFMLEHAFRPMRHDSCVYYHLDKGTGQIDALVSLHVDDTLGTGNSEVLSSLHKALEKQFGTITAETDCFKHFGVNVNRCPKYKHVFACQRQYVNDLKPIQIPKGKAETESSAELVTEFRSLVSGIAWVGVTHAGAAAGASLYQSCLPKPTYEQLRHLNNFLAQLQQSYEPLVFRHGLQTARIIVISDSSLGNVSKYSQGGYFILLCAGDNALVLCGHCNCLSFRSAKSKRVASSTLHSECLGLVAGAEEASHLQTWLYELSHPTVSTFDMINADSADLVPIIGITDCKDLLDVLTKPAVTALTNRSMTLYVAALRELKDTRRVEQWCWCDTRDNVANALTKLNSDGTLPLEPFSHLLKHGAWEPREPFRWGQTLCDPSTFDFVQLVQPVTTTPTIEDPVDCSKQEFADSNSSRKH